MKQNNHWKKDKGNILIDILAMNKIEKEGYEKILMNKTKMRIKINKQSKTLLEEDI